MQSASIRLVESAEAIGTVSTRASLVGVFRLEQDHRLLANRYVCEMIPSSPTNTASALERPRHLI